MDERMGGKIGGVYRSQLHMQTLGHMEPDSADSWTPTRFIQIGMSALRLSSVVQVPHVVTVMNKDGRT